MAASDILMIAVVLFAFGTGFFVINYVSHSVFDQIQANEVINSTGNATAAFETMTTMANRTDYILFTLFIGLVLALIVSSWFVAGNPLFTFLYLIVIVITVVLSAILSNVWESVTGKAIFGTTLANFPLTNNLMQLLPIYMTLIGIVGLVVIFGKPLVQQQ